MAASGILVGLGNPLMADDAVGILVAGEVHKRLTGFDLEISTSGGLEVVDRILGRDFAVIIDSMVTGKHRPGSAVRLTYGADLPTARASDVHGVGFIQAIELARSYGARVPGRIVVYGIEVADTGSAGNAVSPVILERIGAIADQIAADLRRVRGGGPGKDARCTS